MIKFLLVPVIMACALGGTIGLLKVIKHFFPGADNITKRTEEWIDTHK